MVMRVLAVALSSLFAVGCQCSLDTSKLDKLACSTETDCSPGQICLHGTCSQAPCEDPADCPDGWAFTCDGGRCFPVTCGDCAEGFFCLDGLCRAELVACDHDPDCDDRSFCNGVERCAGGVCAEGTPVECSAPAGECLRSVCDEGSDTCVTEPAPDDAECDDDNPCTGPDRCRDEACVGAGDPCDDALNCTTGECIPGVGCVVAEGTCAIDDVCWAAGQGPADNPCATCDPTADPRAWSPRAAQACSDGDDCTADDRCVSTICAGSAAPCDDGLGCTLDVCDGLGGCSVEARPGTCEIGGACYLEGDTDQANGCRVCRPGSDPNAWTTDGSGTARDDGIACTRESCVGAVETHTPDDALCNGQVCALCAGGCATPPSLQVDCGAGVALPGLGGLACAISGSPADACLSCGARVGMTSLSHDTFTGCPPLEDLGWTFEGADRGTCNEEEGQLVFRFTTATMTRTVDTTDFDEVRLCFNWTEANATDADLVSVDVDAGGGWVPVWSGTRPYFWVDWEERWICHDLVAADPRAADNPQLQIRLIVDSAIAEYRLDDISVDAWHDAYVSFPEPTSLGDFTNCDLGEWVAGVGDVVTCPITSGPLLGTDALEAAGRTWEISRTVDVSSFCDDVRIGMQTAAHATSYPADRLRLYVDSGAGEVQVWSMSGADRTDDELMAREPSVSAVDPAVRFQQSLPVRFELTSGGAARYLWLDDVEIAGAVCAEGDGLLAVGAPLGGANGAVSVTVSSPEQATAYVECTWDGRASTTARDQIDFLVED